MEARLFRILITFAVAGSSLLVTLRLFAMATAPPPPPSTQSQESSPGSEAQSAFAGESRVVIYLHGSADLDGLDEIEDELERRRELVSQLQVKANDSQPPVLAALARMEALGTARGSRPLWIINAIAATVSPEALAQLDAMPEVDRIVADRTHDAFGPPVSQPDISAGSVEFAGWASAPQSANGQTQGWSLLRIRAPQVWNLLGTEGDGATVAIVDTGVDWQHPALQANYRGGQGASANHEGNWYSPVQPTQTTPIDLHGHGTHVAGIAVGSQGIGVAPGARWIAVAIADENGRIRDSDVHAAFQWLLAPAGKPDLAPDIVNNSWGTAGDYTVFSEDVRVLQLAGIIPVFAAGNGGPGLGTIQAPASYTGTIGVAAEDESGFVTWFSSRGPSPIAEDLKPFLSAPGVRIRSALPGGRYAYLNGTSMATPHVAGTIALMLSAEPRLNPEDVSRRLANSAGAIHSQMAGWGSLDAFSAVAPLRATGYIMGRVANEGPLPGATVSITSTNGVAAEFVTDVDGGFSMPVIGGQYRLQVEAPGYLPSQVYDVDMTHAPVIYLQMSLVPLPTGRLTVAVHGWDGSALPYGALVFSANGMALTVVPTHQEAGRYTVELPVGQYQIRAGLPGYRAQAHMIEISHGGEHVVAIVLESGPRILLVDSGAWQYRSQAEYYVRALQDNGLQAERLTIRNPFSGLPRLSQLTPYDAVIWSAPFDSPGQLGVPEVITDFLSLGGNLLISGQELGNLDGGSGNAQVWWSRDLAARWIDDGQPELQIRGAAGTPFENLSFDLNGDDSANNQLTPDRVIPLHQSFTEPILFYEDGTAAALSAGRCRPFRLIYLGFGLEGISGAKSRAGLLEAALNALLAPAPEDEARWQPSHVSDFAIEGESAGYRLSLSNLNRELTRTFALNSTGGLWPRTIVTPSLTIGPCETAETVIEIKVPEIAGQDEDHVLTVSAVDANGGGAVDMNIVHTPRGSVLLVDDDNFYNVEAVYEDALDELGIEYDVWETGWNNSVRGSPSAQLLEAYDLVIWFTGYDWFDPVSSADNAALAGYLEGGGRLFLSSQDYLFANTLSSVPRDYFGVAGHVESVTPTVVLADAGLGLPSAQAGPIGLEFGPYLNFGDGLIPAGSATRYFWHDQGSLAGIAASGIGNSGLTWRTVFWAFPFEALPIQVRTQALRSVLEQLSDLGDSRLSVDVRSGPADQLRTYSLVVNNNSPFYRQVSLTNTLPVELELQAYPSTLTYDEIHHQLTWSGVMLPGETRTMEYVMASSKALKTDHLIENRVTMSYAPIQGTGTDFFSAYSVLRSATSRINSADLEGSTLTASSALLPSSSGAEAAGIVQLITYTLSLQNDGTGSSGPLTVFLSVPPSQSLLSGGLTASRGVAVLEEGHPTWRGTLLRGDAVTVTAVYSQTFTSNAAYSSAAYLLNGSGVWQVLPLLSVPYRQAYLPVSVGRR